MEPIGDLDMLLFPFHLLKFCLYFNNASTDSTEHFVALKESPHTKHCCCGVGKVKLFFYYIHIVTSWHCTLFGICDGSTNGGITHSHTIRFFRHHRKSFVKLGIKVQTLHKIHLVKINVFRYSNNKFVSDRNEMVVSLTLGCCCWYYCYYFPVRIDC